MVKMKPANFPDRINERKKRALARMKPTDPAYANTKVSTVPLTGLKSKKRGRRDGKAVKLRF
jgi:hypothetical protein